MQTTFTIFGIDICDSLHLSDIPDFDWSMHVDREDAALVDLEATFNFMRLPPSASMRPALLRAKRTI